MPPTATTKKRRADRTETQYDITIGGRYFAPADTSSGLVEKPYRVTVRLNQTLVDQGALSVFCKHLAPKLMPKKYPDFQGLATHEIISAVPLSGAPLTDIRLMNQPQLLVYIEETDLPVDPNLYEDIGALQQAVEDCEKDEQTFVMQQDALKAKVGDSISIKNEALSMNQELVVDEEPPSKDGKKDKLAGL